MVLDAINSYSKQVDRHLIGRGVKGKTATPLDPSAIIQLNPHLSGSHIEIRLPLTMVHTFSKRLLVTYRLNKI